MRIDFVAGRWSARTRVVIELIGDTVLLLPFTLFMLHFSWRFTGTAFRTGERSTTGGLEDRYLVKGMMPLGFALLAIVVVVKIIQHVAALVGPGRDPASVDWFTRRQGVAPEGRHDHVSGQWLPIAMLVALVAGAFSGYPMGFVMAGIAVSFCLVADVPIAFLFTFVTRIYSGILADWLLLSIPLFVYMGLMLDKSGIAGRLLTSLARLMGPLPGGYAIAVAVIGIIMAASTGIVGASIVMLGLLGLPAMLERGYDPQIADRHHRGLGHARHPDPPSIMLVVLGEVLQVSVGDLFLGALVPGILLGLLFIVWILIGAVLWPQRMPAIERREGISAPCAAAGGGANLVAPLGLIVAVLGSIAAGIATPTEAAAIGALGATVLAAFSREFRWSSLPPILHSTTRTTAMIAMVMIGATCFTGLFLRIGGDDLVRNMLFVDTVGAWGVLVIIMLAVFILGFVLEWVEITFILIVLVDPSSRISTSGWA